MQSQNWYPVMLYLVSELIPYYVFIAFDKYREIPKLELGL